MRRRLYLALAALTAVAVVTGTGGFSTAALDRGVSIQVAEDQEDGLVGVEAPDSVTVRYGANRGPNSRGPVELLTVTNNFDRAVTVEATVAGDTSSPPKLQGTARVDDDRLHDGEETAVLADITCANRPSEDWTVTITVTSEGTSAVVSEEVTIVCERPDRRGGSDGTERTGDPSTTRD